MSYYFDPASLHSNYGRIQPNLLWTLDLRSLGIIKKAGMYTGHFFDNRIF